VSDADCFDWDNDNLTKCQKHGVSVAEIEALLSATPRVAPDVKHSGVEERLVAVGRTKEGRAIFVVFTIRFRDGGRLVRPLSARYMHRKEIEGYESKSS
jgi:hypothetical protein